MTQGRSGHCFALRVKTSVIAPFQPHQSRSAVGLGSFSRCEGVKRGMDPTGKTGFVDALRSSTDSCSTICAMRACGGLSL